MLFRVKYGPFSPQRVCGRLSTLVPYSRKLTKRMDLRAAQVDVVGLSPPNVGTCYRDSGRVGFRFLRS